jgi:hypothetical protein
MTFGAFNVMWWKESGENVKNFSKLNKAPVSSDNERESRRCMQWGARRSRRSFGNFLHIYFYFFKNIWSKQNLSKMYHNHMVFRLNCRITQQPGRSTSVSKRSGVRVAWQWAYRRVARGWPPTAVPHGGWR